MWYVNQVTEVQQNIQRILNVTQCSQHLQIGEDLFSGLKEPGSVLHNEKV